MIDEPFDPTKIDVDISTVNLGYLIDMLINKEIDLTPDFQRASDIWSPVQKSRLIESVLLGLPLPSFYFSEDIKTKDLIIIDGLQRLCAFKDFIINDSLPLSGLQFLNAYEGKHYSELDRQDVRRISSLKVTLNILKRSTPENVKFIIFQRVNTGGSVLKGQEMRNALNQGVATELLKEMVGLSSFCSATGGKIPAKRMEDRDFANRFIAFYPGYQDYDGEIDAFMNKRLGDINSFSLNERRCIVEAFDQAMRVAYSIFGDSTFKRSPGKNLSKAIFDSVSVNIAWLSPSQQQLLIERKEKVVSKMNSLYSDKKFNQAISSGTGLKNKVDTRFSMVRKVFNEVLTND